MPALRLPMQTECQAPPTSLEELEGRLFPLLHSAFVFLVQNIPNRKVQTGMVPGLVVERRKQLLSASEDWESAADVYDREMSSTSGKDAIAPEARRLVATCRLHSGILRFLLRQCLDDGVRLTGPSCDDEVESLLALANLSMQTAGGSRPCTSSMNRRFSLHTGILAPLFLLVVKFCKPGIRDAALQLLRESTGCREGFHDAATMIESVFALACRAKKLGMLEDEIALECMSYDCDYVGRVNAYDSTQDHDAAEWLSIVTLD